MIGYIVAAVLLWSFVSSIRQWRKQRKPKKIKGPDRPPEKIEPITPEEDPTLLADLESALINMGYSKKIARQVSCKVYSDNPGVSLSRLITIALKKV